MSDTAPEPQPSLLRGSPHCCWATTAPQRAGLCPSDEASMQVAVPSWAGPPRLGQGQTCSCRRQEKEEKTLCVGHRWHRACSGRAWLVRFPTSRP